jgi:hypothetical protein
MMRLSSSFDLQHSPHVARHACLWRSARGGWLCERNTAALWSIKRAPGDGGGGGGAQVLWCMHISHAEQARGQR